MIRSEQEYQTTLRRIKEANASVDSEAARLASMDLSKEEIKRAVDPMRSFRAQLVEEAESYERLKRGQFGELANFQGLGQLLIGLRIYQGISQRDLAKKLGIDESQVSRDERNEYHGITVDRANKILETLGVELATHVERIPELVERA
jgi:ribosome-binding protein aMBF1 (putative translation factor)